jgi:hypothetical protein
MPEYGIPSSVIVESDGVSTELHPIAILALANIAIKNRIDYMAAIEMSIADEAFLLEHKSHGAQLLVEDPHGTVRILEYQPAWPQ